MKLVIHNGSRLWAGNEKAVATLATGLLERGHDVVVSCRARGAVRERLESLGIPTTTQRPRGDLDPISAIAFARWLRRQRAEALLLTDWRRQFWGAWAGRHAGVPRVVARLGLPRALRPRDRNVLAIRRWVDAMIVNSHEIKDAWLRSAPWFPADEVYLIPNGVRPYVPPAHGFKQNFRTELGVDAETLLIAGAGHVFPRKGFDILLRAFARAAPHDARIVIVGTGEQLPELRALAASLGIADRVCFLGARSDAANVLAACDIFVLSSRNDSMAFVMLEAMAAGTPVIATEVAGVRASIGETHGRPPAGWIVPKEDPDALANALSAVVSAIRNDPARVRARVEEASWRVANWFTADRMLDEVERALFRGAGVTAGREVGSV